MILSAHQPAYLPWLGYFEKIKSSDVFVYLDSLQFETNSFINRNRIKTNSGPLWLTLPVKSSGHLGKSMLDLEIDNARNWKKKHIKTVEQFYSKAPHYQDRFERFRSHIEMTEGNLAEFCWKHLQFWLRELDITTKIVRLSSLDISERKSDLVLELCKKFEANQYYSGALGKHYLKLEDFADIGCKVNFQSYSPKNYPQLYGDFVENLSVLDAWLMCDEVVL